MIKKRLQRSYIPLLLTAICLFAFFPEGGFHGAPASAEEAAFGSPAPARGPDKIAGAALSLEQCIKIALEKNPELGAGIGQVDAAQAGLDQAAGQRWPGLSATGRYTRFLDPQRLAPARKNMEAGVYGDDIIGSDLVLSLPLFTGGRITNEIRAAESFRKSARNRLARTRQELIYEVSRVFYFILGQRRVIESVEFSKETLERHQKRVKNLIEAGRAARVDLLRTAVRLADVKQKLVSEKNVLAIEHRLLVNLMGVKRNAARLTIKGELRVDRADRDLEESIKRAYNARTDYKALLAEVEAQQRRVDAARAGHWPTVSLVGSYGGRWAVGAVERGPSADDSEDVGQAGIVLEMPLFQGGRISARVREEKAKFRTAKENLRTLELKIRLEVETALLNVGANLERVRATEKAVEQGKESLRIEREKYELGRGSITDVLDAQSSLLDAQTTYYRAMAGYNAAIAQMQLSIGVES